MAVDVGDLAGAFIRSRKILVGQKIMLEPVDEFARAVFQPGPAAVQGIPEHDRDDLVVGLAVVDHAETPDGQRPHNNVAVGDHFLGQHTDVQRVLVADDVRAAGAFLAEPGDGLSAEGLRDEPVKGGADAGIFLRPVDFQKTAFFVDLVFYGV